MMSGDVSLLGDDSLSSLFLALTEASRSPQTMMSIQTLTGTNPVSTTSGSGPTATGSTAGSAGSEAALMGDLFSALLTGANSPVSNFLAAAGDGGMTSQLAALLAPSSSAAASAASAGGIPTLRSSLGSLLGSTSGASSSSNPFSALLQPVASTRSILSQLADAVEQANSVLAAPHWDDLLGGAERVLHHAPHYAVLGQPPLPNGTLSPPSRSKQLKCLSKSRHSAGVDLTRFFSSNRTVLREAMAAMEVRMLVGRGCWLRYPSS